MDLKSSVALNEPNKWTRQALREKRERSEGGHLHIETVLDSIYNLLLLL